MTQVCSQCARVNPTDASYCYFDGVRLPGASANGGPAGAGRDFPSQFVFPSGQVCKNFDQLATACQQNWKMAVDLLKQGFLVNFFGGLGRTDLAIAAQEAAQFPDSDRGLDQFLAKLPTEVLAPPKLQVEPTELNLGQASIGDERTFELSLHNQGMRLLYGSLASDSKWLTFAEGQSQKLFQFGSELTIPLHLKGQHLRAGTKPLEGQILVESNGGTAIITVRVNVPVTPFKEGVLAGSVTPREIAVKAKAQPNEAAPLFEKGLIAEWFKANGWIYPVQGPPAKGLGGIQQFFEALGLAKAPKVDINTKSLQFKGDPGQTLTASLEVSTPEKKPVYAYATCDQSWVDVSKVKLAGRVATISVALTVPDRPGETLQTNIHVQGNGNQRFTVPLSLQISGVLGTGKPASAPAAAAADAFTPAAFVPPPVSAAPEPVSGDPFSGFHAGPRQLFGNSAPAGATAAPSAVTDTIAPSAPSAKRKARSTNPWLVHLAPLGLLLLVLIGLLVRDFFIKGRPHSPQDMVNDELVDPTPRLAVYFDYPGDKDDGKEKFLNYLTFGIWKFEPGGIKGNRLIFQPRGASNSTLVHVDGTVAAFGKPESKGQWVGKPHVSNQEGKGTWALSKIEFTQEVRIIPGETVEVSPDVFKRILDTCLVKYTITNKDSRPHNVGMRLMLDTLIGINDGVPFAIPGMKGLVTKQKEFNNPADIPDYVFALEEPELENPKTVAQLTLRLGGGLEPPSKVQLTRWPAADVPAGDLKKRFAKMDVWDVPLVDMKDDSAVVLYWPPKPLLPGKTRELGFAYGLGSLSASKGGQLAFNIGGSFTVGGELSVVALVSGAKGDEKVTLKLPPEFSLLEGTTTQPVPAAEKGEDNKLRASPVTWRIKANKDGRFPVRVELSSGAAQVKQVVIHKNLIF